MANATPGQPQGRATVTKNIGEWLASIGLAEYADRFTENAIDLSVIHDLTDQDLKELGVLLGHRRKILRAIAILNQAPLASAAVVRPLQAEEAERRHLTVMFCDLVGSTALSERLDPEEMWRLMGSYHACVAEVVKRHQGSIARHRFPLRRSAATDQSRCAKSAPAGLSDVLAKLQEVH